MLVVDVPECALVEHPFGIRQFEEQRHPLTVADAAAFSFVDSIASFPRDTPVQRFVRGRDNLMAYRQRVRDRWFPELAGR